VTLGSPHRTWIRSLALGALGLLGLLALAPAPVSAVPSARAHKVVLLVDKDCPKSGCRDGEHSERDGRNRATVRLLLKGADGWAVRRAWNAYYGASEGDKAFKGDKRTPEGLYFLTGGWGSTEPYRSTGGWFLKLDYPSPEDYRDAGRHGRDPGGGIGLHGGAPGATHGCIRVVQSRGQTSGFDRSIKELRQLVNKHWYATQPAGAKMALPVFVVPSFDARCDAAVGQKLNSACSGAIERLITGATRTDRPKNAQVVRAMADLDRLSQVSWRSTKPGPSASASTDVRRSTGVGEASSSLKRGCRVPGQPGLVTCGVGFLFDRDDDTAWCEGKPDSGEGVTLKVMPTTSGPIAGLLLKNGYAKSNETFNANGRVHKLSIKDGDQSLIATMDTSEQRLTRLRFPKPMHGELKLEILSVQKGDSFDDTCISELRFEMQAPAVADGDG